MSAPDEQGRPDPGDGANPNGSTEGARRPAPATGRVSDAGDVPPWQRGARPPAAQRHAPEHDPRSPGRAPVADTRSSGFAPGTAAPSAPPAQTTPSPHDAGLARTDGRPSDAYASELPDLSAAAPRPVPRTPVPDRAPETPTGRPPVRSQVTVRRRGPVRASMQVRHIDPWSTLKVSLLLSVALFFVWMIAVALLYLVLGGMGVWSKLNSNVGDLLNNTSGSTELVSSGTIFGGAVLIGLVNIVLLTAMATLGAFVYNLTTDVIGGIEVTLADRD
ncbi:DUF3566 domain-containing protein [Mycobacterium sp.]|uniref:DUF3566 domain-containing protein n=1 Tax=Mycobacterium sp. TaxID=1785 RepID=UPI0031D32FF6